MNEPSSVALPFYDSYSNLICYCCAQWPEYKTPKHILVIASYLEAVERGEIDRLILTVPPRHGKTCLVAENFVPWYLGRNPEREIIFATYSGDRADDVGRKVRNAMIDTLHQAVFRSCSISEDSQSVKKFSTNQRGAYHAVGIGGAITGRGAHLFVIDDPIKGRKEAESPTIRQTVKDWYTSVAYTRLMTKNAVIVIQTRWHDDDLAGWLMREHAHENWTVIDFPAMAMEDDDILGRSLGEALWDDEVYGFPRKRLEAIKNTIGTRDWSALYQQRPILAEGGIVNIDWFKRYENKINGRILKRIQSWDTGAKKQIRNAPSVCTSWAVTEHGYYLWHVFRKRMEYPELRKTAEVLADKFKADLVLIEDKSSGEALIQDLKSNTRIPVLGITPISDKITRMSTESLKIESGLVYLPHEAPWLVDYEMEMGYFPYGRTMDQADSTSQFLAWTSKNKWRKRIGLERYYK
ncbi:MAG: phage terminase large subunit [Gammaproteobacteria bacterium]|nr:phage terminase large subunit [Gammaproteobacteria bacterium]